MAVEHKEKLAGAVALILRPLVRLLIRHEFTHTELTELVRQTYVSVAYDEYGIPERDMTVSRAAVLTGLSRKEVVRLRETLQQDEALIRQKPNRAQRVVHGWLSDPEFLNSKKKPLILPIKNHQNGKEYGSFVALVKRYSGDITYGAVLDELNHVGVTQQPSPETVRLANSAYIPRKDEIEQVRIVAMSVTDLFNTALHNIDAPDNEKRFQRQVVYGGIPTDVSEKFRALAIDKSAPTIEELNQFLAQNRKSPPGRKTGISKTDSPTKRVGFGIYHFEETEVSKKKES